MLEGFRVLLSKGSVQLGTWGLGVALVKKENLRQPLASRTPTRNTRFQPRSTEPRPGVSPGRTTPSLLTPADVRLHGTPKAQTAPEQARAPSKQPDAFSAHRRGEGYENYW